MRFVRARSQIGCGREAAKSRALICDFRDARDDTQQNVGPAADDIRDAGVVGSDRLIAEAL